MHYIPRSKEKQITELQYNLQLILEDFLREKAVFVFPFAIFPIKESVFQATQPCDLQKDH